MNMRLKILLCSIVVAAICSTGSYAQSDEKKSQTSNTRMSLQDAQRALQEKGYYDGSVDGVNGPKTQAALSKYQKEQGLTVTGRLDKQTSDRLSGETAGSGERARSGGKASSGGTPSEAAGAVGSSAKQAGSDVKSEGKSALGEIKGAVTGKKKPAPAPAKPPSQQP
jgi:peptidoglycan hydrolase-like protein with peptidoglycan-binding domain